MSSLVMDEDFRARCSALLEWAHMPENYYRAPDIGTPPPPDMPGLNPNHRMQNGRYRIVYSVTVCADRRLYRHLSVSVPGPRKLPHPVAVFTVAGMLGFTGGGEGEDGHGVIEHPGDDWQVGVNEDEWCVVVAQEMERSPLDASHLAWGGG